jgi:hypothetical protein
MKAFKQINYGFENRIVFGYAGLMSLLCFLIMLSPVFAQDTNDLNKNQPKVHYDVKKEFDKDGNLTGYDSTYSWYWSDRGLGIIDSDSIMKQFQQQFDFLNDQWNWSGIESMPGWPPLQPFNYWNNPDSSGFFRDDSTLNQQWFDDSWSVITPPPLHGLIPSDSLDMSIYHFDDLSKLFDQGFGFDQFLNDDESLEKFKQEQNEFFERFQEYQQEHQKLIEKYFSDPGQKNELTPQNEPQRFKNPGNPPDKSKSGTI